MKRYLLLLVAAVAISNSSMAAAGDTTWVQANIAQLSGYGSYDSTVTFPTTGSYSRIFMIFTLGKYVCPGSPTYCGDWDYTVQNYLMTPGGDTMELGRLITPYANAGAPRTPWAWTQRYVYDVTDYVSKLQGSASMRIFFSGYSGGFTANIKFAFIEGTPDRNVLSIERLWHGSWSYANTDVGTGINAHFPAVSKTTPTGTDMATLKFTVTGHGGDAADGCCEFMSNNYQVMVNGASVATKAIWRDNCGKNELYPQSGTWVYDRGNWCPGAMVYSNFHNLPSIGSATPYNVAIQFAPHPTGSSGSYTNEVALINYGPINKPTDLRIEDIISPTNNENHFRENPINGTPVITVKNTGTNAITSVRFACTVDGGDSVIYNWTGSIASFETVDITFPEVWWVRATNGTSGVHNFVVAATHVNGNAGDDDITNNIMRSSFTSSPVWPSTFRIVFRTNSELTAGVPETKWEIYDMNNVLVASRDGAIVNNTYFDTVTLGPAPYRLVVTDAGCNGLNWWANPAGTTSGYISIRKVVGAISAIPMNGYNYTGTYNNDFGCSFTQYFSTDWTTGIANVTENDIAIEAYPNPASNSVSIDVLGLQQVRGTISIVDVMGRVVLATQCTSAHEIINTSSLASGVYTVLFTGDAGGKMHTRLVIAK